MDQGKAYYGPDGTLYVWTGTGYHAVPRIAAGDVGVAKTEDEIWSQGDNPYLIQGAKDLYGITNMDPYSSLSGLHGGNQFALQGDNSQDAFNYWLKSGDKEGSQITFKRNGDFYDPTFAGLQGWDTNDADKRVIPLSIMLGGAAALYGGAMGAGAGLTNSMTGAGGTALAGSETAGLFSGLGGASAAGGAGAAGTGLTLTGSAINPATYSMTPSALMGDGLAASTVGAGIGGGMFDGLGSLGDIIKSGGGDLLKKYGGDLLGGLIETGIGRAGDRQQRINSQDYRDLQINTGAQLRNAAGNYASGLGGLFDKYKGAYDPFYAQVNNGIGTSNIDPVTGKVGFSLNAPYQQQRDSLFGAAGDVMGQMRSFDPRAHAAERYQSAQGLLAEGDARNQQSLMQDLYTKGGFGLTTNQAAAARPGEQIGTVVPGQGSVGVNPYVDTFLNAQNRRNAGMSYDALREGESHLDNLIRRQQGLFGAGQAIDTAGYGATRDAFDASRTFMGDRQQAAGFGYGAEREALGIPYQAEKDYINALFGANQGFMGREAAADQTKQNSYWDTASKLPWGSVWDSISGLFGSKR